MSAPEPLLCAICDETAADFPPLCTAGTHFACPACASSLFGVLGVELSLQGGCQSANYFSTLGLHEDTLPGLLCPLCLPSPSSREAYSHRFWAAVATVGSAPPSVGTGGAAPPEGGEPAYLPGWWLPQSLQALTAWAAAQGAPLQPAHLDHACRGATNLSVNMPLWLHGGEEDPVSPRAHALLQCPSPACGQLLSITARPRGSEHTLAPFHLTCPACSLGVCGQCAQPWSLPHNPVSHASRTCSEHLALAQGGSRGGAHPRIEDIAEAGTGAKRCPNPQCGQLIVHSRGHMCHMVTCGNRACRTSMCFCCLSTSEEINSGNSTHRFCPSYCSDECDCAPCMDCAKGAAWKSTHCDFCGGRDRCTGCAADNAPETEAQCTARLARQAAAQAAHKAANPSWCGPRRERTDTVRLTRTEAAEDPWLWAVMPLPETGAVGSAARDVREGVQLLDVLAGGAALGAPTAESGVGQGGAAAGGEDLTGPECALEEALFLLQRAGSWQLPGPGLTSHSQLRADAMLCRLASTRGVLTHHNSTPSFQVENVRTQLHYATNTEGFNNDWTSASLVGLLQLLREALLSAAGSSSSSTPARANRAHRTALVILGLLGDLMQPVATAGAAGDEWQPSQQEATLTCMRRLRRAAWFVELMSLEGVEALALALDVGRGGAEEAASLAAAAARCVRAACSQAQYSLAWAWDLDKCRGSRPPAAAPFSPLRALSTLSALQLAAASAAGAAAAPLPPAPAAEICALAALWAGTLAPLSDLASGVLLPTEVEALPAPLRQLVEADGRSCGSRALAALFALLPPPATASSPPGLMKESAREAAEAVRPGQPMTEEAAAAALLALPTPEAQAGQAAAGGLQPPTSFLLSCLTQGTADKLTQRPLLRLLRVKELQGLGQLLTATPALQQAVQGTLYGTSLLAAASTPAHFVALLEEGGANPWLLPAPQDGTSSYSAAELAAQEGVVPFFACSALREEEQQEEEGEGEGEGERVALDGEKLGLRLLAMPGAREAIDGTLLGSSARMLAEGKGWEPLVAALKAMGALSPLDAELRALDPARVTWVDEGPGEGEAKGTATVYAFRVRFPASLPASVLAGSAEGSAPIPNPFAGLAVELRVRVPTDYPRSAVRVCSMRAADRRLYRTLAAALWVHQACGPVGCTQGHHLSVNCNPVQIGHIIPTLIEPLLLLLDGKRFLAAPAVCEDAGRFNFNTPVPDSACEQLPSLYAALASAPGALAGGGGGSSQEEAVVCCQRYDVEYFRDQESSTCTLNMRAISGYKEVRMDLFPGMTAGAVLRCIEAEQEGSPASLGIFIGPYPCHHMCTLRSLGIDQRENAKYALPSSPTERLLSSMSREEREQLGALAPVPCALCQSPQHLQAARELQAGPGEALLAGMAAAAVVMRAGWAARGGV